MDIVLVNPGGSKEGRISRHLEYDEEYMYPYSIILLQNYLLKHGITSRVIDLYYTDPEELYGYCKNLEKPLVGVTAFSNNVVYAVQIIKKIKSINPSSIIVVGGKHFSYCPEDTLKNVREIDIIVRGEGEITFYELIKALQSGNDFENIDGLSLRKGSEIKHNPERKPEQNIDVFSLDYEKLPEYGFSRGILLRNYEKEKIRSLPVFLGRGCSQRCVFCSFNKFKYRVRSIDMVLNEISYLKEKYNQRYFFFIDPSFCERKLFVEQFCQTLIREKYDIKWYCEARVDTPIELLELMVRAGCISIDFALESGSTKVLKALRKNINISQTVEFAKNCSRLGIRSLLFFMVSLPEETEDDVYQTLKMARELSKYCTYLTVSTLKIFPGTELETIAYKKGILPADFSWYNEGFYHNYTDLAERNIPLYIENLSVDFIRKVLREFDLIALSDYTTFGDFLKKSLRGIKKIPNQSYSENVRDIRRFYGGISEKISRKFTR